MPSAVDSNIYMSYKIPLYVVFISFFKRRKKFYSLIKCFYYFYKQFDCFLFILIETAIKLIRYYLQTNITYVYVRRGINGAIRENDINVRPRVLRFTSRRCNKQNNRFLEGKSSLHGHTSRFDQYLSCPRGEISIMDYFCTSQHVRITNDACARKMDYKSRSLALFVTLRRRNGARGKGC